MVRPGEPDNSFIVKDIKRVVSYFKIYFYCNFNVYFQSINNMIKCNVFISRLEV